MAETCTIRAPTALAALLLRLRLRPAPHRGLRGRPRRGIADQVDGDVESASRPRRRRIAQIGLDGVDLADLAERLQMPASSAAAPDPDR